MDYCGDDRLAAIVGMAAIGIICWFAFGLQRRRLIRQIAATDDFSTACL